MLDRLMRLWRLIPMTLSGWLLAIAGLVALIPYGIWREDRVLFVIGAAALGLLLSAILFVTLGAVLIRRQILRHPQGGVVQLEVGQLGGTGFELVRPALIPWLDLSWEVLKPAVQCRLDTRRRRIHEHWAPSRRGHHDLIHRRFTVRDVFGLAAITFDLRDTRALHFSPARGALARVEVIQGLSGGDQFGHPQGEPKGDLVDMRTYGPGDPIRFVLWRVYARSRQLLVRTPERALAPVRRTMAYLITSPHDEAAAAVAHLATHTGTLGEDWVFSADGEIEPSRAPAEALQAIIRSAAHPPDRGGSGLAGFLESQQAFGAHRAILFVPGVTGPWVDRVVTAGHHARFDILISVDRVEPPARLRWLRALFLRSGPHRPKGVVTDKAALAALCARLATVGDVRIVDRGAGALYGAAHVAALGRTAA